MTSKIITITNTAEEYLANLIKDKDEPGTAVRVFISDPGTPNAETCLAYCKPDELNPSDTLISLPKLSVYVEDVVFRFCLMQKLIMILTILVAN